MLLRLTEDDKWLQVVEATEPEIDQLNVSLTHKVEGYRFMPLYKQGKWDGSVSFIKNNTWIPSGLWNYVYDIADEFNFSCKIEGIERFIEDDVNFDDFENWVKDYFKNSDKFEVRDYQVKAAYNIIKNKRSLNELATSAGKTFITYIVIAYLYEHLPNFKMLLIVPSVNLVVQAFGDFDSYNYEKRTDLNIQMIYAGQKIKEDSNVVVGTYQSLIKKDEDFFKDFNVVGVDEVHTAKSNSVRTVLSKCNNTIYRFGLTGTIPKTKVEYLTVMSQLGPIVTEVKAKKLQDDGHISKCKINILRLDYANDDEKKAIYTLKNDKTKNLYKIERDYVKRSAKRLKFITKLISKLKGNSLILFHSIEYGNALYKAIKNNVENQSVHYIDGSVKVDNRETFKHIMETSGADKIELCFDDKKILLDKFEKVKMSDGSVKNAIDVNVDDDVDDDFILSKC